MGTEAPLIQPVRVRGRAPSSRRAIGTAAALAGFVVLALAKPWATPVVPVPASLASPDAAESLAPSGEGGPSIAPRPAVFRPSSDMVAAALRPHPAWGLRTLVPTDASTTPSQRGLIEVWTPVTGPDLPIDRQAWRPGGRGVLELATGGRAVIGLGLTGPDLDVPLATRIWRLVPGAVPELVVPQSVPADPGRPIWFARDAAGSSLDSWRPGTYRIDLLEGLAIRRLVIRIPGDVAAEETALPARPDRQADEAILAALRSPGADRTGVALLHDGAATAVPAATGRGADELTSWIEPFDPEAPFVRPARIVAAFPTTIAWFPEPEARILGARVDMLAPIERRFTLADARIELVQANPRVVVLLRWATGRPWPAGVYRIQASWVRPDGSVGKAAWHLELAPARDRPLGNALARIALGWTRDPRTVADRVLGPADVFDGGALARPANACAARRLLDPSPAGIGLTGLGERAVDEVGVTRLFEDGYRIPLRVGLVPRAAEALAIVTAPGAGWQPGAYRINVRFAEPDARGLRSATFLACVGSEGTDETGRHLWFEPGTTVFTRAPGV